MQWFVGIIWQYNELLVFVAFVGNSVLAKLLLNDNKALRQILGLAIDYKDSHWKSSQYGRLLYLGKFRKWVQLP